MGSGATGSAREVVLGVHIPGDGPMPPTAVDESFARAGPFFARHYPEVGPLRWLTCHSWLLDPLLTDLVPGSNLASFTRRWQTWSCEDADRDVLYFAFGVELGPHRSGGRP